MLKRTVEFLATEDNGVITTKGVMRSNFPFVASSEVGNGMQGFPSLNPTGGYARTKVEYTYKTQPLDGVYELYFMFVDVPTTCVKFVRPPEDKGCSGLLVE